MPVPGGGTAGKAYLDHHQIRREHPREKGSAAHPAERKKTHKEVVHQCRDARTRVRRARKTDGWRNSTSNALLRNASLAGISRARSANLEDGLKHGLIRGHRLREKCVPALLGHACRTSRQRVGNRLERLHRPGPPAGPVPKITQKDIPRLYPPGSEIIVQVTKRVRLARKAATSTTNLVLRDFYLAAADRMRIKSWHFSPNWKPGGNASA